MGEADYYVDDTGSLFGSISHAVSSVGKSAAKAVKAVKKVPVLGLPLKAADKVLHSGAAALLQKVLENPIISTAFGPITISYEMALAGAKEGPEGLVRIAKLELKNPVRQAAMKAAAIVFPPLAPAAASYAAAAKVVDLSKSKDPATALKAAAQIAATTALAESGNPDAIRGLELINKAKNTMGNSKVALQKALGAAQALKGSPVLNSALKKVSAGLVPGTAQHTGFHTAVNVLKKTSGNKAALGVARRALPNESARKAFDTAIGTVSHVVTNNPAALSKRAGSIFNPNMGKAKGKISPYQPNLKHAIDSIIRNPTLATQHPMVLANKLGTSQQTVLQALKHVGSKRLMPWRSLSPTAARFVRKWHPNAPISALTHGTNDTAGLDETGTKYIVEKGDFPFKIAQKLTGNGGRWTELKALNKDKKPDITKNVWVGEVLNIPASWQKPTAKQAPSPGPAVLTQPSPEAPVTIVTPAPQISVAPGILQAKAILVAWSKTDGVNQAGVSNYGSTAEDMSTTFGPRDSTELMSFQNWNNKTGQPNLVVDGKLGPKSLAALQSWAETRATQAAPVPQVSTTVPGQVTTLPEVVITATPPVSSPGIPQSPIVLAPAPVVVATPTPASVPSPIPTVASPAQPATPASVAAAPKSDSKMAPALAGAAVGGVLFGLPGAIIGGIAGAAIA